MKSAACADGHIELQRIDSPWEKASVVKPPRSWSAAGYSLSVSENTKQKIRAKPQV